MAKYFFDDDGNQTPPQPTPKPSPEELQKIDQADAMETLEKIHTENNELYQLYQGSKSPMGSLEDARVPLQYITDYLQRKQKLSKFIDQAVEQDPSMSPELRQLINESAKEPTEGVLAKASRVLNFDIATEAGVILGMKDYLSGNGTFMSGFNRAMQRNYGYADVLKEFGVGRGPEMKVFGITASTRGAVGLALDILASPLTYLSFGSNVPARQAAKVGAKSVFRDGAKELGAKSVARWANIDLLTDKELMRGVNVLKQTEAGKAVINTLDAFAGTQLGQWSKALGKDLGQKFIPGFGQNKQVYQYLRKLERKVYSGRVKIADDIRKVFGDFNPQETLTFFDTVFKESKTANQAKRIFSGTVPQVFKDAKMQNALEIMVKQMNSLSVEAGLDPKILYDVYIPSFFEGMKKSLGSQGKSFKTLVKGKALIKDPVVAYGTRATQLYTIAKTNSAIKAVLRKFGKDSNALKNAADAGFREFFPSSIYKRVGLTTKEAGPLLKQPTTFIPNDVLKAIQDYSGKNLNFKTGFWLKMMDGYNQQFKAWVTSVWPAFHFRNAMSNQVLRFLNEGWSSLKTTNNVDAWKILVNSDELATRTLKTDGKNVSLATVKHWAAQDGIVDTSQFIADLGGTQLDNLPSAELSKRVRDWFNPIAGKNNFVKLGRKAGAFIENHAKLTSYVHALRDGYSRGEAAQIAFNGLFDYGNLTAFEKNVMRRLVPFYTFGRKNIELQIKTALQNPGRQATIFKTMKDLADEAQKDLTFEEKQALNELKPKFLKDTFAVPAGMNAKGEIMWMVGFGLPQTDMFEMFDKQGSWFRLNPLIKMGTEQLSGVDIGRTLNSRKAIALKDSYEFKEVSWLFNDVWQHNPTTKEIQDWILDPQGFNSHPLTRALGLSVSKRAEFEKGEATGKKIPFMRANPRALNAIRNTFIARFLTTAKQIGDPSIEDRLQLTRYLTGMAMFNHDLDSSLSFLESDIRSEIGEEMRRSGTGYLFKEPIPDKQTATPALKKLLDETRKLRQRR